MKAGTLPANSNGKKENILTSWKEIAVYLDRDVRTCVRWEQRYGLPVHRLDRDSKAKVFAYKDEIDRWLAERSAAGTGAAAAETPSRRHLRAALLLIVLTGLAAAAYFLFLRPSGPAGIEIRGSSLVVTDKHGREIWSRDTGRPDLLSNEIYQEHFRPKRFDFNYQPIWPFCAIRDLDGDGRVEILFSIQTESEVREGTLIVYDDKGNERWTFEAGGEFSSGTKSFPHEYRIFGFNVDDYDGDGRLEVLVLSHQKLDWPCQAVLLDSAGRIKGEYWNAGYFMDGAAGDVDRDGQIELILSGVNNEYARGCVAVFKPGQLHGASPQVSDEYRMPQLDEGRQTAYIIFPRSDVQEARYRQGDPVNYFWIHKEGGLSAETTETQIIYELDPSLTCLYVTLSDPFKNLHRELVQAGKIHTVIGEVYEKKLLEDMRYYVGGRWLPSPPSAPQGPAY